MAPADPQESSHPGAGNGATDAEELEYAYDEGFEDDGKGGLVETTDTQGRRHIRRAAPEGTEQILENEAPRYTGLPDRAERWRVKSATGTVLTAFAFGLKEVFEPDRNQPAIIMETSGDPPRDLPVEAQLEQLGPRQSSVTVRSWLLGNNLPAGPSGTVGEAVEATETAASAHIAEQAGGRTLAEELAERDEEGPQ